MWSNSKVIFQWALFLSPPIRFGASSGIPTPLDGPSLIEVNIFCRSSPARSLTVFSCLKLFPEQVFLKVLGECHIYPDKALLGFLKPLFRTFVHSPPKMGMQYCLRCYTLFVIPRSVREWILPDFPPFPPFWEVLELRGDILDRGDLPYIRPHLRFSSVQIRTKSPTRRCLLCLLRCRWSDIDSDLPLPVTLFPPAPLRQILAMQRGATRSIGAFSSFPSWSSQRSLFFLLFPFVSEIQHRLLTRGKLVNVTGVRTA